MRRADEANPNYAFTLIVLAFAEATTGLAQEAEAHAQLAIRLSPLASILLFPLSA